jgi:hypothetical protein
LYYPELLAKRNLDITGLREVALLENFSLGSAMAA